MDSERNRLKTFKNWPLWSNQRPELLAKNGFYYTGERDRVKCAFCSGVLKNWQPTDDPELEHKNHFPTCPFVISTDKRNTVIYSKPNASYRFQEQPDMTVEKNRLASFNSCRFKMNQSPQLLARAGFYYYGDELKADRVKCAYCNVRLFDWQPDDDPWVEHARYVPDCRYVKLCMGKEFIEDVKHPKTIQTQKRFNGFEGPLPQQQTLSHSEPRQVSEQDPAPEREPEPETEPELGITLDEYMKSVQVEAVVQMGFSEELIREIVDARLKKEGRPFSNSQELASVIMAKETSEGANCNESEFSLISAQNELLEERYICKICMENPVRITFMPCGHLICCEACASAVEECPICRRSISGRHKTYF